MNLGQSVHVANFGCQVRHGRTTAKLRTVFVGHRHRRKNAGSTCRGARRTSGTAADDLMPFRAAASSSAPWLCAWRRRVGENTVPRDLTEVCPKAGVPGSAAAFWDGGPFSRLPGASFPPTAWLIADTSVCYRHREGQLIVSPAHTSMFRPVFGNGEVEGPHLPMFSSSDSLRRMRIRIKDRSDRSRVRTNI
jgi:hypothetical protein